MDVATFIQWVDAYALDGQELADFYAARFRAEFKPAVDAWIATRPLQNDDAPLTPFAMPQYEVAARAESDRLEAEAEALSATAARNVQRATNYVLCVVLFAAVLFFAGISTKLRTPRCGGSCSGSGSSCSWGRSCGSRRSRSASPSERAHALAEGVLRSAR